MKAILENAPFGAHLYELQPDDTLLFSGYNPSADKILGINHRSLLGKSIEAAFPSLVGTPIPEVYRTIARNGTRYEQEVVDYKDNRITGSYEISAFQTEPNRMMVFFKDITERKIAEQALAQSEARYRSMLLAAPVGMGIVVKRVFTEVNDRILAMTGFSAAELVGQSSRMLYPTEDDYTAVGRDKYAQIASGGVGHVETRWRRKDGTILSILLSSAPIDPADHSKGVTFTALDISERKEMERAIAAEKERLLVTLRSIGDGVIATDTGGRVVLLNKVAEELTGWSQNEAAGRPVTEIFHIVNELSRQPCENPVDKVLKTGAVVGLANHTAIIARNGRERVIADSGAPIRDRESRIIGVVLVFRDITDKQRIEDGLNNAQRLESLGILAGGIAHDFNNLLAGLFGYLGLAAERLEQGESERALDSLKKAASVYERAKRLTQQLLTFSKGGAPIKKSVDFGRIAREAALFALSGSNVQCEFDLPDSLPSVDADENQIAQVVDNIVLNAVQSMPEGGIVRVAGAVVFPGSDLPPTLKTGAYVRLSFRDTGTGISREHLPHIFDPFFTTKQRGSGLGLATVYSILHRHDGLVEVESEPGTGTVFHLYLPVSGSVPMPEAVIPQVEAGHGRVLIMDDEAFICDIAQDMLNGLGYQVETAFDGAAALKRFQQALDRGEPFHAVILDLTIPGGMGGRETLDHIRLRDPGIRVIASSGYSDDPIMSRPEEFGFNGSLIKPYRRDELAALLKRLLA